MPNFSQMFPGAQLPPILAGAMAGAQIPYALQGADQDLQASQIRNMSDLDKLKMQQESEDPMNRSVNAYKQAEADAKNDPNYIQALKDKAISEAQTSVITDEGKKRQQQEEFLYGLGNDVIQKQKAGEKPYDPMNAHSKQWWDDQREQAKKIGVKLPEVPDMQPDGSSQFFTGLVQHNAALGDTIAQRNALAKVQEQNKGVIAGHEIQAAQSGENARIMAGSRTDSATIAANGKIAAIQARNSAMMGPTNAVVSMIMQKKEVPEPLLRIAAETMTDMQIQKVYGVQFLMKSMDPDETKAKAFRDNLVKEKMDYMSKGQIKPEDMANVVGGGTAPTGQTPSATPPVAQTKVKSAADLAAQTPPTDPKQGIEVEGKGMYYYDPVRHGWTNKVPQ